MYDFCKIGDFLKTRATGVGSSDIPILALLKLKHGDTPGTLWREKTGREKPFTGNRYTHWGHKHEGLVLQEYVEGIRDRETAFRFYLHYLKDRDYKEFRVRTEFRHPEYHFAISHPDLLVLGGTFLVKCPKCEKVETYKAGYAGPCKTEGCGNEIKVSELKIQEAKSHSFFASKRDDDDPDVGYSKTDLSQNGIPLDEFLQVQWQLFTSDIRDAGISALIDTNDYREYGPITSDPRAQEKCLALAERFWWHVEHDVEPKPETWEDVQRMFPNPTETTATIGGEDELVARRMIDLWHKLGKGKKTIEKKRDDIKNALGLLIGEHKYLANPEGIKLASSWSQKNPPVTDYDAFKKKYPEVYRDLWELGIITQTERRELRPLKLK